MSTEATPSPQSPVQRWYCKRDDEQVGPWSSEQLLAEAAAGRVTPDDLVKTDAMPDWRAAKSVKGLVFREKPADPPPLPAKPPPLPPKSAPHTLPGRRPAANARRLQPVIWGYVGAALVMLTIGLAVAVVVLKDRERADVAPSPTATRSAESTGTVRPSPLPIHLSSDSDATAPANADPGSQPAAPQPEPKPAGTEQPTAPPQRPKPAAFADSILVRLRGTRWENTNGTTFEWTTDGKFLHKSVERPCQVVGPYSVEVEFVAGDKDTLVFDPNLTRFDQYSTKGGAGPLFSGKRSRPPVNPEGQPPLPTPDRSVAEWVLRDGGTVLVVVPDSMGGRRAEWKRAAEMTDQPLTVVGVRLQRSNRITGEYLAPLTGLNRLEVLDLWDSSLSDGGMEAVASLRSLERLNIGKTRLTPKGLARVGHLTNLTELNIAGLPVDTDAVRHIGKLTKLVALFTGGCQIPDADFAHLTGLRRLEILGLIDNFRVTNRAMTHLGRLKALRAIRVKGTKLSNQAIKRVLPNCEVSR
jgi:hypothetical protein